MKHYRLVHRVDVGGHFSSVEDMLLNQQIAYVFFPKDMKSGFVCEQLFWTSKCLTGESVM